MSSILDALEKLERSRPPSPEPPSLPPPRRRGRWGLFVGAVLGAGAALALRLLLVGPSSDVAEAPAAAPEPTSAPAAEPGAPAQPITAPAASPPVAAPAAGGSNLAAPTAPPSVAAEPADDSETPSPPPPIAATSPPAAPVLAAAPPVPPPAASEPRPWAQPVAPAAPTPVARPAPPSPSREPLDVAAARRTEPEPPPIRRAPAGAPDIRLSFLLFSPSPERRSVALAIDGSGLQTLHEGESSGGLEVVRILPDRVDLRWQGEAFTVRARD